MKRLLITGTGLLFLLTGYHVNGQAVPEQPEQQLENLADMEQGETEDDALIRELEQFRKHPLNLNTADADELRQISLITDLQVTSLLAYRDLLGKLIHVLELQAVPGWDLATIRKVLPYINTGPVMSLAAETGKRFSEGEHQLLFRISQVLEKSKGYRQSPADNGYKGSPQHLLFRYSYRFKNGLQYGLLGDKDAGENFGRGAQRLGFDFYSVHLFARRIGTIQSLAFGDFTVNMGQGLIQWQSLAFKKSTEVMAVKRQSAVLRPYHSAGEYNFHRGAGITIKTGKYMSTLFISYRKLSANIIADSLSGETHVSSLLASGYHRNQTELDDRNTISQLAAGGCVQFRSGRWQAGINGVFYRFPQPLQKREETYNRYAIQGRHWVNASIDYSYTYRNLHLFGEAALDQQRNTAFIHGLLISVDAKVDISLVQRTISARYQSVSGNAFTENVFPTNETGIYMGISIRPAAGWKLDAYADLYRFPWLRFGADAPGTGNDWVLQLSYTPNRETLLYSRFRQESKETNQQDNTTVTNYIVPLSRMSWRTQLNCKLSPVLGFRSRVELLWYNKKGEHPENGFLGFLDFLYHPLLKPWSGGMRLQYVETEGFHSRIYAFENDVLYSYSIPVFSDKGFRYYINLHCNLGRQLSAWLRWAQTIYFGKKYVGSGLDEVPGNKKSELKLQLSYTFQ
ncbi:MAG: helix-hairpin-helix domain-containing protein [Sphingobacteriales bacterium]|nr:helix-hairpin-helix domain-containing protein [Sphingobacteriales bacterium]